VPYIKAAYLNVNQCCENFIKGIALLEQGLANDAIVYFQQAYESVGDNQPLFLKYRSYYGFSCLLNGQDEAIDLCRHAAKLNPSDGDICMNLSRAEIFLENHTGALVTVVSGLRLSPDHEGLQALKINLKARKVTPLLQRIMHNSIWPSVSKQLSKLW